MWVLRIILAVIALGSTGYWLNVGEGYFESRAKLAHDLNKSAKFLNADGSEKRYEPRQPTRWELFKLYAGIDSPQDVPDPKGLEALRNRQHYEVLTTPKGRMAAQRAEAEYWRGLTYE